MKLNITELAELEFQILKDEKNNINDLLSEMEIWGCFYKRVTEEKYKKKYNEYIEMRIKEVQESNYKMLNNYWRELTDDN